MSKEGQEVKNIVTEQIVINRHFNTRLIPVTADKKSIDEINKALDEGFQALTELEQIQSVMDDLMNRDGDFATFGMLKASNAIAKIDQILRGDSK